MRFSDRVVVGDLMGPGSALRKLARVLDECEMGRVNRIEIADDPERAPGERMTADIELTIDPCNLNRTNPVVALSETSVDTEGKLYFAFETVDAVVPPTHPDVSLEPSHAAFDSDGTVTVTLSASLSTDQRSGDDEADDNEQHLDEASTERLPVTDGASGSTLSQHDRDVPPFRDPELLAEVYETCETFNEMPAALGMDVTAETVRRYMIDYGIHEPRTYETSRNASEETTDAEDDLQSPVVLADGIGLPDGVTVDAIIETVKTSNTIYEVGRDLGCDREDALDMLRGLNLLELVVGRLATEAEREVSREEITERLRQRAEVR